MQPANGFSPAPTRSGHIEPGSLKRQHSLACEGKLNRYENERREHGKPKKWNVEPFVLYTLRHTCLTRWAPHMDPWTLAYLAGHRDMSMTKRYIHPQEQNTRAAIERARSALGGHKKS
jgi:integrase